MWWEVRKYDAFPTTLLRYPANAGGYEAAGACVATRVRKYDAFPTTLLRYPANAGAMRRLVPVWRPGMALKCWVWSWWGSGGG